MTSKTGFLILALVCFILATLCTFAAVPLGWQFFVSLGLGTYVMSLLP